MTLNPQQQPPLIVRRNGIYSIAEQNYNNQVLTLRRLPTTNQTYDPKIYGVISPPINKQV